jgi:hypothetical protein
MQALRTTSPRIIVILLLLHVTASHGRCDEPISFEHALKVIEACESKYKTVEWNVEYNWGYFDNLISPKSFKPRDAYRPTSTHTIFEFHTGKYRFETAGITPWKSGSSSFTGERRIYTFDGENVCLYVQNCHEQRLPRSGDPQVAEIGPGTSAAFLASGEGQLSGIGFFSPIFQHQLLSKGMVEANARRPVVITQSSNGKWLIKAIYLINKQPFLAQIEYDPENGGVIRQVNWFDEAGKTMWQQYQYEYKQLPDGLLAPMQIRIMLLLENPSKLGVRIVYNNIKHNTLYKSDDFQVKFPTGTNVTDYTKRVVFTAGVEATEQEKVKKFMEQEALWIKNNPAPGPNWVLWVVVGLVSATVLMFGLLLFWKRRKPVANAVSVGAVILLATVCTYADDSVKHVNSTADQSSQKCGMYVTLYTLEFLKATYDHKLLTKLLDLGPIGLRMSDIKMMLEVHGLSVKAVENASTANISRHLSNGALGIIPIKVKEDVKHYIVLQQHPDKGLVQVDPPYSIKPLTSEELGSLLSDHGGLALIVSLPTGTPQKQNEFLKVSPGFIDIGTFDVLESSSSKPVEKRVAVTNTGPRPIMVQRVFNSCGCTKTQWGGGILRPKESIELTIEITKKLWGLGQLEKPIVFEMADKSSSSLVIKGYGQSSAVIHELQVFPLEVRQDIGDYLELPTIKFERTITIQRPAGAKSALNVSTTEKWLQYSVQQSKTAKDDPTQREVELIPVKLTATLDATLFANQKSVTAFLELSTRSDKPPIQVPITLFSKPMLEIEPSVITLKAGESKHFQVKAPEFDKTLFARPLSARSDPEGLQVSINDKKLKVTAPNAVRPAYYLVHVTTEKDKQRFCLGTAVVYVPSKEPASK